MANARFPIMDGDLSPSKSTEKARSNQISPRKCPAVLSFSSASSAFVSTVESWTEFEWCKCLCKHLRSNQLKLALPRMFIFNKTDRAYFAFKTNEEGLATAVQGVKAWDVFFNSPSTSEKPMKFLALDKCGGSRTINNHHSAHEYATQTLNSFILIVLDFDLKKKVAVRWSNKSGGSIEYEDEQIRRPDPQVLPRCFSSSLFQHDIEKFKYAGRLKKSSFSPLLPHNSVLAEKLASKARDLSRKKTGYFQMGMEELMSDVLVFMQKEYNSLGSMTLHAFETSDNSWLLFNVTNVQWITSVSPLSLRLLPPVQPVSSTREEKLLSISPVRKMSDTSCRELTLGKSLKRPPYIDMREVHANNIQLYERIRIWQVGERGCASALLPRDSADQESPEAHAVNHVTKMFEMQSSEMRAQKAAFESNRKVLFSSLSQPGRLTKIFTKLYKVCSQDEMLEKFFPATNETAVHHLSERFERTIAAPHNYYLSKRVHEAHKCLEIREAEFSHFMEQIVLVLREDGTGEEETNLVMEQMYRYKDDVLSKV